MMADPHSLVEGVIISAYAIRCHFAVIYVRGEAVHAQRRLRAAVQEAYAAGYLGSDILGSGYDLELVVHSGAGAYICGEETALLDSLEGYRGQPRLKPPFPAVAGLYAAPTVINNVETIASVPFDRPRRRRLVQGDRPGEVARAEDLLAVRAASTGPGQYEAPMGTTMRELLEMAGGVRAGPRAEVLDAGRFLDPDTSPPSTSTCRWTSRASAAAGSMLGTTALKVFDETTHRRGDAPVHRVLRARVAAASAPPAARAPTGWCRSSSGWWTATAPRGPRPADRHLRQHPGPLRSAPWATAPRAPSSAR